MIQPKELIAPYDKVGQDLIASAGSIDALVRSIPARVEALVEGSRRVHGRVSAEAFIYDGPVYVDPTATVEPGAYIAGPAYIGANVVLRHGSYVRADCIFLDGAILGHASEAKNSVFFSEAKAPHFAYVGDSILGERVNLGAGTKLSNVKISHVGSVMIPDGSDLFDTGLRKFGAILGDDVSVGCNAVLNPGVIVGPRSLIYPGLVVAPGVYAPDSILKLRQQIEVVRRR
jgi:NDP-sugar pyrophosphorylase family protein